MAQEEFLKKVDELYEEYLRQGAGCGAGEFCGIDLFNLLLDYKGVED